MISFIGAGNLAHHLAHAFYAAGIEILEIHNRNEALGRQLSQAVEAQYIPHISDLSPADVVIIAVSDNSIQSVANQIPKRVSQSAIVVHTSGGISVSVLQDKEQYGVFYPLQSFLIHRSIEMRTVPIFVTCHNPTSSDFLQSLARYISDEVIAVSDIQRSQLHLSAVMVNNFTNHIFQVAHEYCKDNQLNFKYLIPLIKETVLRLEEGKTPKTFQTGPAFRGDWTTIEKHRLLLEKSPRSLALYNFITDQITSQ